MIARLVAAVLLAWAAAAPLAHAQTTRRSDLVIELYTSQGCSQCPRANRMVNVLQRDDDVLALTFGVGMWDYLGWRDTFAQPEFSDRQRAYQRSLRVRGRFTPQLILNGMRQISAADWDDARAVVDQVRAMPRVEGSPNIGITRLRNGRVRASIGAGRALNADIWLVAFDPGPISVRVSSGLNFDRNVTHYNVVRSIERAGTWNGAPAWYERRCAPQCAVLVQQPRGGRIIAAAHTRR